MRLPNSRILAALLGVLTTLAAGGVALADDTEIFFNQTNSNARANVMLILDTSGSMDDNVQSSIDYDPTRTYTANQCSSSFSSSNVYYSGSTSGVPSCGSSNAIPVSRFTCSAAAAQLATGSGATGPGYYLGGLFIRWGYVSTRSGGSWRWSRNLGVDRGYYVDCKADAGIAGAGDPASSTKVYPSKNSDNSNTTGSWDSSSSNSWWNVSGNTGGSYTIYSANYLNWYYDSSQHTVQSKIRTMQSAAGSLLDSLSNMNVGLMRYSYNGTARGASGGMVMSPVQDIATGRASMKSLISSWAAAGNTPLSETLFEAYRYFSGGALWFGNTSNSTTCLSWMTYSDGSQHCSSATWFSQPSVAASRTPATATGANYDSAADYSCQKNYVVYLTDGLPTTDNEADTAIKALPNFAATAGSCLISLSLPGSDGTGLCTAALSKYMYKNDLRSDVNGQQNVTSYYIGFGGDFSSGGAPTAAFQYLQDAATAGGGKAYTATSLTELTSAFSQIFAEVASTNTLFSAPAVAVNAFNRTQTLNDLYVSVFSPKANYHWPGNVKKYKVVNGEVVDANGNAAVDNNTGFFKDTSLSYWTNASTDCIKSGVAGPDGYDVTCGGAAWRIPDPGSRNVYTYIGANPGSAVTLPGAAQYALSTTNSLITATLLGIGGSGDPSLTNLVNWARGVDVQDENADGSATDTRHAMGDPIHTAPGVVIYGHNGDGTDDGVAYVSTNDGYVHAVDVNTGQELWSFIPQEMLGRLKNLYIDGAATSKHYGLDGAIRVLKYDINGDGIVDSAAGDRVILFLSTGHNADTSMYYALDVTSKTTPKYMWGIGSSVLPDLGQAWSEPTIARVNISGATQNSQKLVLVIGGGYDASEDGYTYMTSDGVGNHIYMVDALKGTLLWSAGPSSGDFTSTRMDHAIPASIAVLDTNDDGYADRMYVGDMAAQLWRFDIWNGQSVSNLVTGGVIASLGTKEDSTHTLANTRRFYITPDVAAAQKTGVPPYMNIAIGSGYRGHPLNAEVNDRFYSIRDYNPFTALTQSNFNSIYSQSTPKTDSDPTLIDITTTVQPTIPPGSLGWKMLLDQHGGWAAGEKVLVPSRTFSEQIIFTTYTPNTSTSSSDPCLGVGSGTNRVYVVSVFDASPSDDKNNDGSITVSDRSADLSQGGIAPETAFLFPGADTGSSSGGSSGGGSSGQVVCLSGVEVLSICTGYNQRKKTYWREGAAN